MSVDWHPDSSVVSQTVGLLQALRDPVCPSHASAIGILERDVGNPMFALHAMHVFALETEVPLDLRQLAGLIVKNQILKTYYTTFEIGVQNIIKRYLISAISDREGAIRNTATNLLGGMSRMLPSEMWSDIVGAIVENLNINSTNKACVDGSIVALKRLSEDAGEKMASDGLRYPLLQVVPVLFSACKSPDASHRLAALEALIALVFVIFDPPPVAQSPDNVGKLQPPSLSCFVKDYLAVIAHLSNDPDMNIRSSVCQAIVLIMTSHPETLTGSIEQICSFMLSATAEANPKIAIEATEFWTVLADVVMLETIDPNSDHILLTNLLKSIPLLLSRMPLTAEQVEVDRANMAAEIAGEKDVTFGKGGGIYHHRNKTGNTKKNRLTDSDDDDSGGGENDLSNEWTLRRQCASVFDYICSSGALLPSKILEIALPIAKDMLQNPGDANTPSWVYLELGILIIGALANGCATEMEPHLPILVPFLCQQARSHELPEVRSIACWVLGRYSEWTLSTLFAICDTIETEDGEDTTYISKSFDPNSSCYDLVLSVLLHALLDGHSRVQSAALSAMNALVTSIKDCANNEASVLMTDDRLQIIFQQISQVAISSKYGVRNCLILCDLIAVVCEAAGPSAGSSVLVPLYMPFVMHHYLNVFTDDNSVYLFPVMEAVTAVLGVVGAHIHPYAMHLIKRSVNLADHALKADMDERQHRDSHSATSAGSFHSDFVVCAFDIIGALSECLVPPDDCSEGVGQTNFSLLLTESGTTVPIQNLILAALSLEDEPDVLQSSFALCGELFRTAISAFLPSTPGTLTSVNIIEEILKRIVFYVAQEVTPLAAASNALWATGEAVRRLKRVPGGISGDFVKAILPPLLTRLHDKSIPILEYTLDRYGSMATHQTTPDGMDPSGDLEVFLESLGSHDTIFLQNAAVCLGRIAVLDVPLFLQYLETPTASSHSFLQCFLSALALVSSDPVERNHAFIGLLSLLQTKPDLIQLVSASNESPGEGRVSDSVILFLFAVTLAWRETDIVAEDSDIYLSLRHILMSLRQQLSASRDQGVLKDRRLVGVYKLFKHLTDSFHV